MQEGLLSGQQHHDAVRLPTQAMEEGLPPGTEQQDEVDEMPKDVTTYQFEDHPRPVWRGNFNVYISVGAVVVLWFAFGRGMPYKEIYRHTHDTAASVFLLVHVVAAGLLGCICIINVFHTPSHGPLYRSVHIFLGRLAIPTSVVAIAAGLVRIFTAGSFTGTREGLLAAAAHSIALQGVGMYAVWKPARNLELHKDAMHGLLFVACFGPAVERLPLMMGVSFGSSWHMYWWVIAVALVFLNQNAMRKKTWF